MSRAIGETTGESFGREPSARRISTEVEQRRSRRRFIVEYKMKILAEIDACKHGEVGAILRREGLYSSHIETWREQSKGGLMPKKRGRKPCEKGASKAELDQLRRENERLTEKLRRAEVIISVQKKLSVLLGAGPSEVSR